MGWRVVVRAGCRAQLPGSPPASSLQCPIGRTERSVGNDPVSLWVPRSPGQVSATWSVESRLLAQQRPLPTKWKNCSAPELLYVSF